VRGLDGVGSAEHVITVPGLSDEETGSRYSSGAHQHGQPTRSGHEDNVISVSGGN
jgi:hypothetical protein